MTQNLENYRRTTEGLLAASQSGDWEGWLEEVAEIIHPDIVWDASRVPMPDLMGEYRGKAAVVAWWRDWLSAWETLEFEYEMVESGDHIVLLVDQRMRGRSTGIEVETGKYAHFARFEEGMIIYWTMYADQAKALEAAGIGAR